MSNNMNLNYDNVSAIADYLGIEFKYKVLFRAELIMLRSDNLSYKEISSILNVPLATVQNYYNKRTLPRYDVISKLELLYLDRLK